jgi:hypothetical protein
MHPSLTSREQDLAALPKHQRLLSNLGILAKSQTHAAALHENLRRGSNDHAHSKAPSDPKGFIRRASPDMTLTPAQRQGAQREESRQEAEQLRRMSEARANGGIEDEDDEEIGPEGYPVSSGSSLSKSVHKGSFQQLRAGLHSYLAKSQPVEYGEAQFIADLRRGPVVKAPTGLAKSIEKARTTTKKSLGVSTMSTVNTKMQSIARTLGNDQLAKSIGTGGPVRGLRMAAPQYSTEHVEFAAQAALAHGAIDAQSAQVIANSLALGGVDAVPRELMAKLRGE